MHKKAEQNITQMFDAIVLLQTLEQYQTFCYNLYLLATYYADKPHALKSAGSKNYTYDSVGNTVNRNGDTITYNPLNKPATLTNHSNNKTVTFTYGAGGQRYMKQTSDGKQTYYLGKAYEEQVEDNTEKQICYITLGGKTIGTHTEVKDTNYVTTNPLYNEATYNRYFHTDALGSITAITDDSGRVVERRSYEAFGKIRAMDYGLTSNHAIIPTNTVTQTTRAFTGHEQIAELSGLIHMNARVYDSDIGRFLSADTIIQDPYDSQAYNRYSYVRNNPMVFTDPSGHSWFSKLWDKIKPYVIAVVVAVIAVYTGGLALGAMGYGSIGAAINAGAYGAIAVSGAVGGFAAGVSSGLLNGASLGDSMAMGMQGAAYGAIGAVTAGYIGGIKSGMIRASLHGITRAAISKAQGNTWHAGFWSGFASSALAPVAGSARTFEGKVAMSAIVGGTASELGGGKFANGAVTGAFVMMYNELGHENTLTQAQFEREYERFQANDSGLIDVSGLFSGIVLAPFRILAGVGKLFSFESRIVYTIGGKTANQEYHAWRYVDADGVSRTLVRKEIDSLMSNMTLKQGFNKAIINVENNTYQVNMFKFKNNTINIGSIHAPTGR